MIWDEGLRTALPAISGSSFLSAQRIFGGRRTVDGQRCFEQRSAGSPLLSVQRLFWPRSGTGLAEGETGQAEPDWPPEVTGIYFPPAQQHHFPGSSSGHHFRRRSLGASLPDEVGLASCQRQPCVNRLAFLSSSRERSERRDNALSRWMACSPSNRQHMLQTIYIKDNEV
jgi:hypothetical protein